MRENVATAKDEVMFVCTKIVFTARNNFMLSSSFFSSCNHYNVYLKMASLFFLSGAFSQA